MKEVHGTRPRASFRGLYGAGFLRRSWLDHFDSNLERSRTFPQASTRHAVAIGIDVHLDHVDLTEWPGGSCEHVTTNHIRQLIDECDPSTGVYRLGTHWTHRHQHAVTRARDGITGELERSHGVRIALMNRDIESCVTAILLGKHLRNGALDELLESIAIRPRPDARHPKHFNEKHCNHAPSATKWTNCNGVSSV